MRLLGILTLLLFLSGCYTNSVYVVSKKSAKFSGKFVKVKGRVKTWFPALDYGFYLVILENKGHKIAVYKQLPYLQVNQKLVVKGKFYPADSLLPLPYNLVVDSSIHQFDMNRSFFAKKLDTIEFKMEPRFKLPANCP